MRNVIVAGFVEFDLVGDDAVGDRYAGRVEVEALEAEQVAIAFDVLPYAVFRRA